MKLVTAEPGSREVRTSIRDFLGKGLSLYTVDIALAESLNAIWKHVKIHRDLRVEEAEDTVQDLVAVYDRLGIFTARELIEEATDTALTQNITIYDSLYIAAARKLKATLYTSDRTLHEASKKIADSVLLRAP